MGLDTLPLPSALLRVCEPLYPHHPWTFMAYNGDHHHQSVLPKGRSFTISEGSKAAVLAKADLPPETQEPSLQFCTKAVLPLQTQEPRFCPKAGLPLQTQEPRLQFCSRQSSTANSGIKAAVLAGMNRCGSFPLLSAPHSLFNIWADLKISEKIPGAPTWRLREWIWLTGPSGLHRNSPSGF